MSQLNSDTSKKINETKHIKKSTKTILLGLFAILGLVLLDQVTKFFADLCLKGKSAFVILDGIFELKYLENQSAAFGMDPVSLLHQIFSFEIFTKNPQLFLQVKMGFFVLLTMLLVFFFVWFFLRIPEQKHFLPIDLVLIFFTAGAIGNFIDRVRVNYVIDFFYFKLIDFPIFNVADIYVTCAAIAMILLGIFYYKDEDFDLIFPSKKNGKTRGECCENGDF